LGSTALNMGLPYTTVDGFNLQTLNDFKSGSHVPQPSHFLFVVCLFKKGIQHVSATIGDKKNAPTGDTKHAVRLNQQHIQTFQLIQLSCSTKRDKS
jgi:hypothetical protein